MGPIWGQQDPGGPHVGPMNFVIWVVADWLAAQIFVKQIPRLKKSFLIDMHASIGFPK